MRYLVTLKPLEPFLFGGDNTFGKLGDSYSVHSRLFPQQTTLLGMLQKEMMIQAGYMTRKRKGEWADNSQNVKDLVGSKKFDLSKKEKQNFGKIDSIGAVFLKQGSDFYIKKANIDKYPMENDTLQKYNPKEDIFDNYICTHGGQNPKTTKDIFKAIEQIGNKKGGEDNALFRKTSYLLNDGFTFAFFLETSFELRESIVHLGADRSSFKMTREALGDSDLDLNYTDPKGYLVLLSDSYIGIHIDNECCTHAITSELSFKHLMNKKGEFNTSKAVYFYERGSIFLGQTQKLIDELNNANLQQIGYNKYSQGEQ